MPAITLPDGSIRRFDAPVTGHRAGRLDRARPGARGAGDEGGRHADGSGAADRAGCARGVRHAAGSGSAGDDPARCRACAGRGGAVAVSGHAGDDRAVDRERVLLRFRAQRAVQAGGFRGDRGADAGDRGAQRAVRARGMGPRRGDPVLRGAGRALQGRADPRPAGERGDHASTSRATGSICAAGRICAGPAMSALRSS